LKHKTLTVDVKTRIELSIVESEHGQRHGDSNSLHKLAPYVSIGWKNNI
jgi:hypothetical protein